MEVAVMWTTDGIVKQASPELLDFWQARDTCFACGSIASPIAVVDGVNRYQCGCDEGAIWTREA